MLSTSKTQLRYSTLSARIQQLSPSSTTPNSRSDYTTDHLSKQASTCSRLTCTSPSSSKQLRNRHTHAALIREASTDSSTSSSLDASASETTSTASPSSSQLHITKLNWNEYLALRKSRRRYNLFSSISTSACTTAAGVSLLNQNFDYVATMAAIDPMVTMGISTVSSAAVGWLTGPVVGSAVFNMLHRRVRKEMDEKEKDFYRRIKRYRVDPSSQSMSNPVPDYYGEKIGSVADYRSWMKDQRAYNKKRQFA